MEDFEIIDGEEQNTKIYKKDGCIIKVKREFEKGGISILEQIIGIIIDFIEKENQLETQISKK